MKYVAYEKARSLLFEALGEYENAVKILAKMKCDNKTELERTLADIKAETGSVMREFDELEILDIRSNLYESTF